MSLSSNAQPPASPLTPIADTDVFILGLRRSGIHATIMWLIPHFPGLVRLANDPKLNTDPIGTPPFLPENVYYYAASPRGFIRSVTTRSRLREWEQLRSSYFLEKGSLQLNRLKRIFYRSIVRKSYRAQRDSEPPLPALIVEHDCQPADANIISIENMMPHEFAEIMPRWHRDVYTPHLASLGLAPAPKKVVVLILREPWNQLASVIKHPKLAKIALRPIGPDAFTDRWIDFAREFAGQTSHLDSIGQVIKLNYDQWFKDADYRRTLLAPLGVEPTDAGLQTIADFGGGSSFDKLQFQGNAQTMKVGERWQAYRDHPLMIRLCSHPEVKSLVGTLFGHQPPDLAGPV